MQEFLSKLWVYVWFKPLGFSKISTFLLENLIVKSQRYLRVGHFSLIGGSEFLFFGLHLSTRLLLESSVEILLFFKNENFVQKIGDFYKNRSTKLIRAFSPQSSQLARSVRTFNLTPIKSPMNGEKIFQFHEETKLTHLGFIYLDLFKFRDVPFLRYEGLEQFDFEGGLLSMCFKNLYV